MSTWNRKFAPIAAFAAIVVACTSGGCGGSDDAAGAAGPSAPDVVAPRVVLVDRTTRALTAASVGSINGTYGAGCRSRTGPWSVAIGAGGLANPALTVVLNDTACVLTLTEIVADQTYIGASAIALTDAYQTASAFAPDAGAIAFYANAHLDIVTFAANFVVTILFSDNSSAAAGSNTATASTVTATVTAEAVPAPNYTIVVSGIAVTTDSADIVQTAAGDAQLTGTVTGEEYVIVSGSLLEVPPTYSAVDGAFTGGGTKTAISGTSPTISAAAFGFVPGETDLSPPWVRSVIISHAVSGVRSYEVITVTFSTF